VEAMVVEVVERVGVVELSKSLGAWSIITMALKVRNRSEILDRPTHNLLDTSDNPQGRRQKIGNWLTSLNFKATQLDIFGRRTEGTCQWFLESSEFKAWNATAKPKTLLCTGDRKILR
jgi:hypothetical protein